MEHLNRSIELNKKCIVIARELGYCTKHFEKQIEILSNILVTITEEK